MLTVLMFVLRRHYSSKLSMPSAQFLLVHRQFTSSENLTRLRDKEHSGQRLDKQEGYLLPKGTRNQFSLEEDSGIGWRARVP